MARLVTIRDISKECGVSTATVSKALNGYGDISEETREKVLKCAHDLHYIPNAAARSLKTSNTKSIGVIYQDKTDLVGGEGGLTHEYFSSILNSAKKCAESRGYDITFLNRNIGNSYLEHCRYRNIDGVLVVSADFGARDLIDLVHSDIPLVTIDYTYDSHSSVNSDNVIGAYTLTKYLIDNGHRDIAFIYGETTSVTKKRFNGFYRAMSESGINVRDEFLVEGRYHDPKSSGRATRKLLSMPVRPTAIMYPDDISYLGGRTELEKEGLSVPEDISVVGYDGIKLASLLRPMLTTYHQDVDEIGKKSMSKLLYLIENGRTAEEEIIKVQGYIEKGQTVRDISK